jgi:hypothetical protein
LRREKKLEPTDVGCYGGILARAISPAQTNRRAQLRRFVLLSVKILFSCANFFPAARSGVAQICNLLYRRIAFGGTSYFPDALDLAAASG